MYPPFLAILCWLIPAGIIFHSVTTQGLPTAPSQMFYPVQGPRNDR